MLHLAQHFESDGGMNHCNFLLAASNFKIFSQNISRLMLFSSKPNFRRAHQFSFSVNKFRKLRVQSPVYIRPSRRQEEKVPWLGKPCKIIYYITLYSPLTYYLLIFLKTSPFTALNGLS